MNDLIKIEKTVLNGAEINSVNAREIHSKLEVKTHLSTWIQRAIEKYDFVENIDFSILKSGNPNGGISKIDYIVTLDMAKELSMLENNPKGKEYRKYFIDIEKKYFNQKPLTINEQISLIAQGHQEVEQRLSIIEHKVENDITLTSSQKHHLKNLVSTKVYELFNKHQFAEDFIKKGHMRVWKKLKNYFVVSSYMEIPKVKFDEACKIVTDIKIGDLL